MSENKVTSKRVIGLFYGAWIGALVVAAAVVAGLVHASNLALGRQTAALAQQANQGEVVLAQRALRPAAFERVTYPGEIHGFFESPIYAKVSGYVKSMHVDKGNRVKTGEVVAIIDSPETDQQVNNARANYWLQVVTDRRDQTLYQHQVIAAQDADTQHALMLQAKAAYQQDLALQAYEIVRAPFDGMITRRNLDPGAYVSQGGVSATPNSVNPTGIYEAATLQPLRIYVQMPQDQAAFLHDGDASIVTVSQFPQREFRGAVTRHPTSLDQATRTMQVEVDLPNTDLTLYPGMYARVSIDMHIDSSVAMVPDRALIFKGRKVFVPVIRNNRLHLSEVELGFDDGVEIEITRGLVPDELIATNMGQLPQEGELVHPVMAASTAN